MTGLSLCRVMCRRSRREGSSVSSIEQQREWLIEFMTSDRARGRLFCGTSGFSYPAWAPRFYAPGTRAAELLPAYGARLNACELNNTFYQQPKPTAISGWLAI